MKSSAAGSMKWNRCFVADHELVALTRRVERHLEAHQANGAHARAGYQSALPARRARHDHPTPSALMRPGAGRGPRADRVGPYLIDHDSLDSMPAAVRQAQRERRPPAAARSAALTE